MNRPSLPMYAAFGGCCTTDDVEPSDSLYSAVKVNFSELPSLSASSLTVVMLSAACLTRPITPQPRAVAPSATAAVTEAIRDNGGNVMA